MTIRIAGWQASWMLAAALAAGCHNPSAPVPGVDYPIRNPSASALELVTPIVSYGTITAFGSVWVNGVHYDTLQAAIKIDDQIETTRELHVGDVVRVIGRMARNGVGPAVATSVEAKPALHGPVSSVDVAGASLVVLGQTVAIDAGVIFDESIPQQSLAGLAVGDVVEVAGLPGRDGKIFASRIAKKPLGRLGLKVTGTATNVDPARLRFTINGLVVDFGRAWVRLPSETVHDGDRVEVLGSSLGDGELVAREIRPGDPRGGLNAAGTRMDVEGLIVGYDAESLLLHGGSRLTTDTRTYYEGARLSTWIDAKVVVQGVMQPDNSVVANGVRFFDPQPVQIRARVDSVNPAAGSLVVLGITVETRTFTRMTDESAIHAQPFGLSTLAPGDYVHVGGREPRSGSGVVVASLVERIDAQDETLLQGYATEWLSYSGPLSMLGVSVSTTAATRYPTPTGGDIGELTFFFDLGRESLIEARGIAVADRQIVASELRYMHWPWW